MDNCAALTRFDHTYVRGMRSRSPAAQYYCPQPLLYPTKCVWDMVAWKRYP